MKMSIFLLSYLCDNLNILNATLLIKKFLEVVIYFLPMILIVLIMIDFGKSVISGDDGAMKKSASAAIRRIVAAVAVLFIPQLLLVILNSVGVVIKDFEPCINITQTKFDEKVNDAKKKCEANKNIWSDSTYQCTTKQTSGGSASSGSSSSNSSNSSKNLIYHNQGDYAHVKFCSGTKTVKSSGCGATSLSIITSSFTNTAYNPQYIANWLCSNGHGGGALYTSFFTSQKVLDTFNLSVSVLWDLKGYYQGNAGKQYEYEKGNKLLNAVKQGKGVILYVPGHYLVVGPNDQCSSDKVYLYDVGRRANNGCYTTQELFNKLYNYNNKCSNNNNCGWKGAWAYTSK